MRERERVERQITRLLPEPKKEMPKEAKNGGGRGVENTFIFDIAKSTTSAAATEVGELFQYEIKDNVSLARQKSALLPIINQPIEGKRVSIYNERVQAKHPMLGLMLKNSSKLHLMQGPVTVYEEHSYAGDALLPDLRPGEDRLISYAVDLGVEVVPGSDAKKPDTEDLVTIKISQGILHATYKQRQTRIYTVANRNEQPRDVIIEHAKQQGWHVVMDKKAKAPKETRDAYRFEVSVESKKTAAVEVVLERMRREDIVLTNSPDDTLRLYILRTKQDGVKKELTKAMALKSASAETLRAIEQEREAIASLEKNQARLRENLKILEKTSDLYKSSMKRFEAQENEFDQRQACLAKLQMQANKERREYETFLRDMKVE